MVNEGKHGMFGQNRNKFRLPNNRINSLPTVAGTSLRAGARNAARYAGC
jgi:hypothetical protein